MLLPQGLCTCCSLCLDSFGSSHLSFRSLTNVNPLEGSSLTTLNKPAKSPIAHTPYTLLSALLFSRRVFTTTPMISFSFIPGNSLKSHKVPHENNFSASVSNLSFHRYSTVPLSAFPGPQSCVPQTPPSSCLHLSAQENELPEELPAFQPHKWPEL